MSRPALCWRGIILALGWMLCAGLAAAEGLRPIDLPAKTGEIALVGLSAEGLREKECCLTPEQALAGAGWQAVGRSGITGAALGVDAGDGAIWLRATLLNGTGHDGRWLLDTQTPRFRAITVWIAHSGQPPERILHLDADTPFAMRPIAHRHIMAPIALEADDRAELFLRYEPFFDYPVALRLALPETIWAKGVRGGLWDGLYFGAVAAMIGLAFVGWPILGARFALGYVSILFSGLLWSMAEAGLLHKLGLVDSQMTALRLAYFFLHLTYSAGLVIALAMFNLGRWRTAVLVNLVLQLLTAFLCLFILPGLGWMDPLSYVVFGLGLVTYLTIGVVTTRAGNVGGLPILIGTSLVVVIAAVQILVIGNDPSLFDPHNLNRLSLLIYASGFGAAMVARAIALREDRNSAERAVLEAEQERLRLNQSLLEREKAFQQAQREADSRRTALQSLGHDMAQPLVSLRRQLSQSDAGRMATLDEVVSYLEQVVDTARSHDTADEEVDVGSFPIALVMETVHSMFEENAREKGLEFSLGPVDATLEGESVLLMRALSNLVVNAISATDAGGITLKAERQGGGVAIRVADTGRGMTGEEIDLYLQRGRKGPQSRGSGLGLAFVADAAAQMGAELTIDSRPGQGTVFTLIFPSALSGGGASQNGESSP